MSLWLTHEELVQLTGYVYRVRQRAALVRMKIPFRSRDVDGFPLVLRSQFDKGLTKPKKTREPRLDLVQ